MKRTRSNFAYKAFFLFALLALGTLTPSLLRAIPAQSKKQSSTEAKLGDPHKVEFDRDIRPLLNSKCLKCHGPDKPESDLDLTRRAIAMKLKAVVPNSANKSSLIERVSTKDKSVRMPPNGESLSANEIQLLKHRSF